MARPIAELLEALGTIVNAEPGRSEAAIAATADAEALAKGLAWVHRTGLEPHWLNIFEQRRLSARACPTLFERTLGLETAVYFFVGRCAYPKGTIALLMSPMPPADAESTFTPYDTGALDGFIERADGATDWDDSAKTTHLAAHLGRGLDVEQFVAPFLAAHFRAPVTYVRGPQESEPDFPAYHGLVSKTRDRRAWTIEARVHGDVLVDTGAGLLREVCVDGVDLFEDLPAEFKRLTRVVPDGTRLEDWVAHRIEHALGSPRS